MERVLVGLQGNSSRSPSSSFLAWVPGEYARQDQSPEEPKACVGAESEEGKHRFHLTHFIN
jgi:hypothetical protein